MRKMILSSLAVLALGVGLAASAPATKADAHTIGCRVTAVRPVWTTAQHHVLKGVGKFSCTGVLDLYTAVIEIQTKKPSGAWVNETGGRYVTNIPRQYWTGYSLRACPTRGRITKQMRTKAQLVGFHGNWKRITKYSTAVTVRC